MTIHERLKGIYALPEWCLRNGVHIDAVRKLFMRQPQFRKALAQIGGSYVVGPEEGKLILEALKPRGQRRGEA